MHRRALEHDSNLRVIPSPSWYTHNVIIHHAVCLQLAKPTLHHCSTHLLQVFLHYDPVLLGDGVRGPREEDPVPRIETDVLRSALYYWKCIRALFVSYSCVCVPPSCT